VAREVADELLLSPHEGSPSSSTWRVEAEHARQTRVLLRLQRRRQSAECYGSAFGSWNEYGTHCGSVRRRVQAAEAALAIGLENGRQVPDLAGAACLRSDPAVFFPEDFLGQQREWAVSQAQATCRRCPVNRQCLELALRTEANDGVWAGTLPMQRRILRRADAVNSRPAAG
jgi:WhiB family redox-sensing transcriptional regulator